jgi:hypothetical protein
MFPMMTRSLQQRPSLHSRPTEHHHHRHHHKTAPLQRVGVHLRRPRPQPPQVVAAAVSHRAQLLRLRRARRLGHPLFVVVVQQVGDLDLGFLD